MFVSLSTYPWWYISHLLIQYLSVSFMFCTSKITQVLKKFLKHKLYLCHRSEKYDDNHYFAHAQNVQNYKYYAYHVSEWTCACLVYLDLPDMFLFKIKLVSCNRYLDISMNDCVLSTIVDLSLHFSNLVWHTLKLVSTSD